MGDPESNGETPSLEIEKLREEIDQLRFQNEPKQRKKSARLAWISAYSTIILGAVTLLLAALTYLNQTKLILVQQGEVSTKARARVNDEFRAILANASDGSKGEASRRVGILGLAKYWSTLAKPPVNRTEAAEFQRIVKSNQEFIAQTLTVALTEPKVSEELRYTASSVIGQAFAAGADAEEAKNLSAILFGRSGFGGPSQSLGVVSNQLYILHFDWEKYESHTRDNASKAVEYAAKNSAFTRAISQCSQYLEGTNFYDCDLRGIQFGGAALSNASLENCDLRGAFLENAKMVGVDIGGAYISDETNLSGADLSGYRGFPAFIKAGKTVKMSREDFVKWAKSKGAIIRS